MRGFQAAGTNNIRRTVYLRSFEVRSHGVHGVIRQGKENKSPPTLTFRVVGEQASVVRGWSYFNRFNGNLNYFPPRDTDF
jgi:hypothetical protein